MGTQLSRSLGSSANEAGYLPSSPSWSTAACLARTRDLNGFSQLTVVPLGLDADSMLRPQRLPTVRGMADSTISHDRAEQQFFVSSFDSLWPALSEGEPVVHGIKIDVQGMELSVLRGMSQRSSAVVQ